MEKKSDEKGPESKSEDYDPASIEILRDMAKSKRPRENIMDDEPPEADDGPS